jgi:hypothetical protein
MDLTSSTIYGVPGEGKSLRPVSFPSFTVALLPTSAPVGSITYATNGRRGGEGAGLGTGCPVYRTATSWNTFYDNTTVLA